MMHGPFLAAGPLLHPYPWRGGREGRPARSHGPYGQPAAPNWQSVAQYSTVWCGGSTACVLWFSTLLPQHRMEITPTSQSGAAARMDQCMHGTDHTCICMHACPSCLILLSSILSHPLLLSHYRGTFAMAHPCHACFLGISLSQLGVGAHSDWSSACASSKGQDHAEMQFLWIVSIITKPSYAVLTHTWNNVKQPKVPVYKTFGSWYFVGFSFGNCLLAANFPQTSVRIRMAHS
jgi:hypothetical protein